MFIATGAFGGQQHARAVRFNGTDEYMERTGPATTGSRAFFTWDVWVRRAQTGRNDYIYTTDNAATGGYLRITTANTVQLFCSAVIPPVLCDVTSSLTVAADVWVHVHVVFDTSQAAGNRVQFTIDGVADASPTVTTAPSGTASQFGLNIPSRIGSDQNSGGTFEGDLALFYFVDSSALPDSDFAATINGTYQAIQASPTYSTAGFFLDFDDASDLGNDTSGNGNDFTLVNMNSSNSIGDGPPANF